MTLYVDGKRLDTLGQFFDRFGVLMLDPDLDLTTYHRQTPVGFLDLPALARYLGYAHHVNHQEQHIDWITRTEPKENVCSPSLTTRTSSNPY